ncbi:hypothetical protein HYN69_11155 [Gemmobacter aquarius]|uniref:TspO and MBR related proteins n=1 Tax=Paragemmobacter aquarius TaxID=2169400 RepID=A0A2S0UMG2_9RHOB|nr:hypothetical protein [Gemmobacter aquarius]AWB48983.1 hypothetical protein HYN69_11155 [Gemmobacter aquarius]
MSGPKQRAVALLLATLAFGAAPLLTPPFTGYDPAQFPVVIARPSIQPAGYAFSIWSVIYLWLIAHAVIGLWKHAESPVWDRPRLPLTIAIALGAAWLSLANAAPITATVAIWIMAATALAAFLRATTDTDRWLVSAPAAIFAGWLSAAAAVSTGVVIAGYGLLADTASALAMLALVLALAITVQTRKPAMPLYGLTVIWALFGVVAVNWTPNPTVAYAALAGMAAMAATLAITRRTA